MLTTEQVIAIIDKLDSLGYIRKRKITGDWYTCYCPFHKDGKERKPSSGVLLKGQSRAGRYTEAGFWNCFTCHHSAPLVPSVDRILRLNGVDTPAVEWLNSNISGLNLDGEDTEYDDLIPPGMMSSLVNKYALEYISSKTNGRSENYITEDELSKYRFTVPYMYERGLTDSIIDRYDIGFDAEHIPENRVKPVPCITFPVRDIRGRCLFIFRRSVEGRYFNYPTGVLKPVYGLYELRKNAGTVVICESAFNMITCIRHGYDAVALFGTGNKLQIQQLKELGVHRFILALDPDEAGTAATEKLRRQLSKVAFISTVTGYPAGKDLNDLTDEEFDALVIE